MSINVNMDSKLWAFHSFGKSNLVTDKGGFDYYTCEDCGLKGKRYGLDSHIALMRPSKKKMANCDGLKGGFNIEDYEQKLRGKTTPTGKKIKIILDVHLDPFDAKNGEVYEVIETPKGENKSANGVWVNGKNGSFRVLPDEYEFVNE
jgi:hypothetical protein